MKKLSLMNKILLFSSFVSVLLAIITFVFALINGNSFVRTAMFIVSLLLLVLALFISFLVYVGLQTPNENRYSVISTTRNYFLFPKGQKRPILKEQLSFEDVDRNLVRFIKDKFNSPVDLWQSDIFSDFNDGQFEQVMSVLVAYKMLLDLVDNPKVYRLFYNISFEELLGLCERLRRNGDDELSDKVREWREKGADTIEESSSFLTNNQNYIKRRMVILVRRKSEIFDE